MALIRFIEGGGAATAARVWRVGDRHYATIAVKSEISFASGAASEPRPSRVVVEESLSRQGGWAEDASDLALYLGRAEVLFFGSLHGPAGHEAHGRLLVQGGSPARTPLVDKRVFATLPWRADAWASLPVGYRMSRGHPADWFNPVGRPDAPLQHASAPNFPAALGPVSSMWPARRALLREHDAANLAEDPSHVTQGFNFNYFHASPSDQRCARHLDGGETIVLEALTPRARVAELRLPSLRAEAVRLGASAGREPVPLVADLLRVFGDDLRVTLTWRATIPLASADEEVVIAVAVVSGRAIDWDAVLANAAEVPMLATLDEPPESRRMRIESRGVLGSMTMPFMAVPSKGAAPPRSTAPVPGAPWAGPLPNVPGADAAVAGTALGSVNLADLAEQALARRAAKAAAQAAPPLVALPVTPHVPAPFAVPVAPAAREERVTTVTLRDRPGSRFLALMLSELRKRDGG